MSWNKESQGREQDNELDRFIIQGQDHLDQMDHQSACVAWSRVWDHFLLRLSPKMTSCQLTLPVYDGSFHLADWLQDYCSVIHNIALNDTVMAKKGATFCTQVLLQFPHEDDLLLENFRASQGEFHFLAGEASKGEEILLKLIADKPHRSIGYAYLADMLGESNFNIGEDQPIDLQRGIALLEKGLAYPVEDAEDYDLEKRLGWLREAADK